MVNYYCQRPHRKMPAAEAIASYHYELGNLRDGLWPACFGCVEGRDEWGEFDRAHLVDRCFGGLDGSQNLVLLCQRCHKEMPSFGPEDGHLAWAWVRGREHWLKRLYRLADEWLKGIEAAGIDPVEALAAMERRASEDPKRRRR